MLVDKSITDYMNDLASSLPAPGGGSVAALTGALGASLLAMVCHLTIGKEEFADIEANLQVALQKSDELRDRLTRLVDEDAQAFSSVIKAFKMPKDTAEEKAARTNAIQTGYKKAADIPYTIATTSLEVLVLAKNLIPLSNPNVITDVGVAALNAQASVESAIMNVNINLPSIKDEVYVNDRKRNIDNLLSQSNTLKNEIGENVNKMLQVG
ncbi:MAG: cyclodeaminase/cyclohydrolase family protein [Syntrophomonadaceae bacterium]|nr:cyclodeaminase/cyclohydrolase family protein [Syntrophomonadaceae bacterium]